VCRYPAALPVEDEMAVSLASLWLPILLTTVAVLVASLVLCIATPLHKNDWRKLRGEDAFLDFVRGQDVAPGQYMCPAFSQDEMKDPAKKARFDRGPWCMLRVLAAPNMGRMLGLWSLHLLIVALFVGYVAHLALGATEPAMHVFRLTSAMALIVHAGGALPTAVWEGKPTSVALKSILDGVVYALITGAIFAWRWSHLA
jgi:hypothetical protein